MADPAANASERELGRYEDLRGWQWLAMLAARLDQPLQQLLPVLYRLLIGIAVGMQEIAPLRKADDIGLVFVGPLDSHGIAHVHGCLFLLHASRVHSTAHILAPPQAEFIL
jgi:hypothetical protein